MAEWEESHSPTLPSSSLFSFMTQTEIRTYTNLPLSLSPSTHKHISFPFFNLILSWTQKDKPHHTHTHSVVFPHTNAVSSPHTQREKQREGGEGGKGRRRKGKPERRALKLSLLPGASECMRAREGERERERQRSRWSQYSCPPSHQYISNHTLALSPRHRDSL